MYKEKTFLAIIPARGGSKGLPRKNIRDLCGKPLIAWSIEKALKSKFLDEIMVTTDSEEIAQIARQFGANVPFLRPVSLASDTATTFDAVKHVLDFYEKKFDYIVLLEPTSPLREDSDIDAMIQKLVDNADRFDSIVSIGEVSEHPSILKKVGSNDTLLRYCEDLKISTRRQDNDRAYFPYGVGYLVLVDAFLQEKTFYTRRLTYHIIQRYQCYEIDDLYDFLAVENIMKHTWSC